MKKDTGIRVKYGVPYFIVRVMAIGMLFLILNTSNILAATESPVVLDLSLNQTTLEQVFRELEKQSGYSIIYKSSEVNLKEVLSVDVSKEPLENVLNKVLRKQGLYLQPIITQYFIDNKSEIWLLFLIAHSKR